MTNCFFLFIMVVVKDVIKMKLTKKKRAFAAAASAMAIFLSNSTVAIAASVSAGEDIRERALDEYLSANGYVVAMTSSAGAVVSAVKNYAAEAQTVELETITETQTIAYNTVKRLNEELEAGKTVTVREGTEGEKSVTYNVKKINGEVVSKELAGETVNTQPVDKIVEYGNKNTAAAASVQNSGLDYKYVVECTATAYDMSPEENGGYGGQTATGVPLDKGVIAVDPRVIPLGSRVYIEALDGSWSYGYAVAADTGGAIKGNRVDLCYRTRSECIQFGRRKCRVYVLN